MALVLGGQAACAKDKGILQRVNAEGINLSICCKHLAVSRTTQFHEENDSAVMCKDISFLLMHKYNHANKYTCR